MHIRSISRCAPERAVNIEQIFDLIIQAVNTITALESIFGFDTCETLAALKNNDPSGCNMQ